MIRFVIKKSVELEKLKEYGFEEETKRWVLWGSVVKMSVDKKTRLLHFNMPDNKTLSIYTKMVQDDIIGIVDNYNYPKGYHYIGLTDDEFEMIQELRAKKYERK